MQENCFGISETSKQREDCKSNSQSSDGEKMRLKTSHQTMEDGNQSSNSVSQTECRQTLLPSVLTPTQLFAAMNSPPRLVISRTLTLPISSPNRNATNTFPEASNLTLSYMIEHSGACSTLSLSGMLSRHFPLIRILRAVHSILQQSVLPGYHLTSGSTSSGSVSVSSDDLEQQSETRAEFMSLITMDSALYMYRLAESFVEGSTSFMILAAGSEVEFRSITEESQSSSLSPVVYITGRHNRHRDMWLDVDNMSYEELLALEDRIGYVSTGLSEEEIIKFLKPRKYFLLAAENAQKESCSICQEDYIEDDELGTLDCSHGFHVTCIHQWLRCKNICPICKSTGLQTNGPSYYI